MFIASPTVLQGSPATSGFGSGVLVGVGSAVGVGVGEGFGEGVGVGVGEGFGAGTKTPLFQTSFFPLFTQVNFLPPAVIVCPAFLQAEPGFGAVAAWAVDATSIRAISGARTAEALLIGQT